VIPSLGAIAGLLLTGTAAGLDLASGPQVLLARPLVVGTISGLILGQPAIGLAIGSAPELFALEVLPVGASRYPDHGPGAVGAVAAVALAPAPELWRGLAVGLLLAMAGAQSLLWMRRGAARMANRAAAALQALEPGILGRLQWDGFRRDLVRSLLLTLCGLLASWGVAALPASPPRWPPVLNAVALGAGAAAALNGALRSAGSGRRVVALWTGLVAGLAWTVLA
jgi:PTS system mannose-specific IIC component